MQKMLWKEKSVLQITCGSKRAHCSPQELDHWPGLGSHPGIPVDAPRCPQSAWGFCPFLSFLNWIQQNWALDMSIFPYCEQHSGEIWQPSNRTASSQALSLLQHSGLLWASSVLHRIKTQPWVQAATNEPTNILGADGRKAQVKQIKQNNQGRIFSVAQHGDFLAGFPLTRMGVVPLNPYILCRKCGSKCLAALCLMGQKHKLPKPWEMLLGLRFQDSLQKVSQVITVLGEAKWDPHSAWHLVPQIQIRGLSTPARGRLSSPWHRLWLWVDLVFHINGLCLLKWFSLLPWLPEISVNLSIASGPLEPETQRMIVHDSFWCGFMA